MTTPRRSRTTTRFWRDSAETRKLRPHSSTKGLLCIQQGKRDAGVHELRQLIQRHPQTPEATQARAKLTAMGVHNTATAQR